MLGTGLGSKAPLGTEFTDLMVKGKEGAGVLSRQ
jgi:hypothetical protein